MGYYAEAERAYNPDRDLPASRWEKRDKMKISDVKKILEDFIEDVTNGGKDYRWCGRDFGAPVSMRLDQPGTPVYESSGRSLVGQPGYGEDSVLKVQLSFGSRYYLVDLTDTEKLQKKLDEIAEETYARLEEWDNSQAEADSPDDDEDEDEED